MRWQKASFVLLIVVVLVGGAVPVASGDKKKRQHYPVEIAVDDPIIGSENAREFSLLGECNGSVCASESPVVYMPFGCEGKSDNPHKSRAGQRRNKWEITGKSQTVCPSPIRRVAAANQLWRNHFLFWGTEGRAGYKSKSNANYVEAVAVTGCGNVPRSV